jgi:hypothetical protein
MKKIIILGSCSPCIPLEAGFDPCVIIQKSEDVHKRDKADIAGTLRTLAKASTYPDREVIHPTPKQFGKSLQKRNIRY